MKLLVLLAWIVIVATSALSQTSQLERDFESKKAKYTFEHFAEGEDATSGYDYLFYKSGDKIVKIRSIWSASHSKELRIADFYFDGTELLLFLNFIASNRLLNSLKKGRNGALIPTDEFHFTSGKLTKWITGGKAKAPDDFEWDKTEKQILDQAKSQRDYYGWLKEGKF